MSNEPGKSLASSQVASLILRRHGPRTPLLVVEAQRFQRTIMIEQNSPKTPSLWAKSRSLSAAETNQPSTHGGGPGVQVHVPSFGTTNSAKIGDLDLRLAVMTLSDRQTKVNLQKWARRLRRLATRRQTSCQTLRWLNRKSRSSDRQKGNVWQ